METGKRIEHLLAVAARERLGCLVVIPGPNMVYLTGLSFHLSERPVVAFLPASGAPPQLVVPELERAKAEQSRVPFTLHTYTDEQGPGRAFEGARAAIGFDRLETGVEGRRCRFLEIKLLGGIERLRNADKVFAELRMRKDGEEIAAMRRAVAIAESALRIALASVRAGVTEAALVAEITLALLRQGSGEFPFAPFAAAGANGAVPHAVPGDHRLGRGELVTIDWGASQAGYYSDITRTYCVAGGTVAPRLRAAYDAVLEANAAGRAAVKPGATAQDVDRAARTVIAKAGFGEYFIHRTGHGLGLECHEEPDIREGSAVALEPGMTFTIEPGIYIPGLGGIRIEDDILVTSAGGESLTGLDRSFTTVG